jgi:ribosomal protein L37AE/L43A
MQDSQDIKEMREHIRQSVNALELCATCQRICECEQRHVNGGDVWVCVECAFALKNGGTTP